MVMFNPGEKERYDRSIILKTKENIEKVKERVEEIIKDHINARTYTEDIAELEYFRGKIEAYQNCITLINHYVT